jgi:ubiquinone/menaquinone biosynthesis C-methylase UbiE
MVDDGASKKEKVKATFDDFSASFDEVAGKAMLAFTRLLLKEINIPENPVCLDVGCGTGISTFELAKRSKDEGTISGIDISQLMIDQAENNPERLKFPNIRFSIVDAEQLDFPDSMFDLVISNQTLPFIPNRRKALTEIHRVLKPGGQTAHLFYGGSVYHENIKIGLEVASRHPEYPSFMEAVVEFRDDLIVLEEAVDLFESAGFMDHRIYGRHVVVFLDPSFWLERGVLWDTWRSGLPMEAVDGIRDELMAEFRRCAEPRGFKHTSYNIIAVGIKSE